MKRFCTFLICVISSQLLLAQSKVDSLTKADFLKNVDLNLLLRSSLEIPEGQNNSAAVRLNEARFEVAGKIVDNLDFRVRYRLNRSLTQRGFDNAPAALDIASVNYSFGKNKNWSLNVGKQAAMVGSWEFETNPTFEYQYSEYINFQTNIFLMAARLGYQATPKHFFSIQLHNTFNDGFNALHSNNGYSDGQLENAKLPLGVYFSWIGKLFNDQVQTFWSYNISQVAKNEVNHSFALGQKVELPKFHAYLDLQSSNMAVDFANVASPSINNYRRSISPSFFPQFARNVNYKSAVAKLNYEIFPKWYLTSKIILEAASQYGDGKFAGNNFRKNTGLLGGIEYKPFNSQQMKLFGYYYNKKVSYNDIIGSANTTSRNNLFAFGVLYFVNAL